MVASTRIEAVLVVLAYAGLALWWLWPLPTAPAAAALIARDPFVGFTDYYLVLWILAWGAHALSRSPLHLFDANVFHPAPASLAFSEHLLGHQPLFAPVYWISGNAVLAANVLLFAMQVACAATTYALVRRFASSPAAFLAGTLFAFCPWRYETTQQFHLLGTQYLPLVVLCAERLLERGQRRDAWLLTVAASLQVLSSVYFAFATVLLLAGYLPLALVRWRTRLEIRRATRLAMALAVPAILLGATSLPYMRLQAAGLIPVYWQGNALGVEHAPAMVWRLLTTSAVGALGYLLGAVALLPPWHGRGWPCLLAVAMIAIGLVFGSGPVVPLGSWELPTPYSLLVAWLPGFSSVRVPVRFVVVAMVGFALLAALGFDRLPLRRGRWLAAAAAIVGILWTWSPLAQHPLVPQPVGEAIPPVYRWLAANGEGRPLVELPPGGFTTEARRMYFSTVHWLPLVGGYTAYPPPDATHRRRLVEALPDPDALDELVAATGVGWIVVHTAGRPLPSQWAGTLPPGLALVRRWPEAALFRVTRPQATARGAPDTRR